MEWGNIILVAVSGLVGVGGTLVGIIVNNHFTQRQMKGVWAEEERRGKSDRRRELYERDLRTVSDFVHAIVEAMAEVQRPITMPEKAEWVLRFELLENLNQMIARASVVTISLDDQELGERFNKLIDVALDWVHMLDFDTGQAKEGKEKEFEELAAQTKSAAAEVLRRIREILEEV